MSIISYHTGTPVAGRHAAPVSFDGPRIPADCLAFAIGKPGDTNQIRGYWVRDNGTSHMELENEAGEHFSVNLDQVPMLGVMLRNADSLNIDLDQIRRGAAALHARAQVTR